MRLNVVCGLHNHDIAENLEGQAYVGRLSAREMSLLNGLLTLKDHNKDNVTTIKQVYNARQAFRASQRGPKTEWQQLMKLMERDKYVLYWHRKHENSNVVRDILWTHPYAIKLLNMFHIVLIIDTTYKINKYQLPLLEIVGVTSTGLTFSVAFAYMEQARSNNFTWVLEKLRAMILILDTSPQVIVTDKDIALMNAVEKVFPMSAHLLCQFHIARNVKAKCKLLVSPINKWEPIMGAWMSLMHSATERDYEMRLTYFEQLCSSFPTLLDYVKNTWLIPHKEKFVAAWTNMVMHLGTTSTNRGESAHSRLNNLLQGSRGDLCNCWDAMNDMIVLQHTKIKASFERSMMLVEQRFNIPLHRNLKGFVSLNAMALIDAEKQRINIVGVDSSACGCTLRITHGLPCACELASYYSRTHYYIPLSDVHTHWKRLEFPDQGIDESWPELSIKPELEAIQKRFEELDVFGKWALKCKLREILIAFPDSTSMYFPPEKVKTKGGVKGQSKSINSNKHDPSCFEYMNAMPSQHDSASTRPSSSWPRTKRMHAFRALFPGTDTQHVDITIECNYIIRS
ncbi:MULE transposase domain [Sesbania bispinosa]|nr:MULE transposase domain [Sesbania bispinosa]